MLRAIIVDDEQNGIDTLKLLIESYISDVRIVACTTESGRSVGLIEDYKPEIVFMDINMPLMNGFEVLRQLHYRSFSLIFTTAHREYALQAIKNNAVDYLLKPVDIDDLNKALDKVRKNANQKQIDILQLMGQLVPDSKRKILIHTREDAIHLGFDEIIRIEAASNSTVFITLGGTSYTVRKTLKEFEDLLNMKNRFMRIHHSHIINLNMVSKYLKKENGLVVMVNGDVLPVSRAKKDELLNWFNIH